MNRIFVTGDTHRNIDVNKLSEYNFPQQKELDKTDYLIIAGDFGGIWYGNEQDLESINIPNGYMIPESCKRDYLFGTDDIVLGSYEKKNYTTLFIDGNHENHKLINTYPVEEWNGGLVHRIRPTVIHLMRGQVYEIGGHTIFTMGGATSVDRAYRVPDVSWWEEELPSEEEYHIAEENLKRYDYHVDYLITHCCSIPQLQRLTIHNRSINGIIMDTLTEFLGELEYKLTYKQWFYGHHHMDVQVDDLHRCLYQDVVEIE